MNNPGISKLYTWVGCLLLCVANVPAATTDLSSVPLVTAAPVPVSPNLFLMMDDSGSMDWDFMPDNGNSPYFGTGTYGYQSHQCNGVYYNPGITYTPPVRADGTSYPNATFTAAWMDGFQTTSPTVNLSTKFKVGLYESNVTPPSTGYPAYYYQYTGTQTTAALKNYLSNTSTFYKECNSTAPSPPGSSGGNTPGSGVFTYVQVSSTSGPGNTDERQNFANWFSYYRTRVNMMKTGAGLAFNGLNSSYRVGFATMNNNNGSDFVNIAPFNSTGKANWYSKLYGVSTGSSTPLLEALSKVGLMYANKLPNSKLNTVAASDPVEYACQQNFAILSTDGYWNVQTNQTLTAGPSNTAVGNQDGDEPRPMFDGATSTVLRSTSQIQLTQQQTLKTTTQLQKATVQIQKTTSQIQVSTSQLQVSTSQLQVSTSQLQMSASQLQKSTSQLQKSTSQLQISTSQLQISTSQLQVSTSQLQKRTSADSGGTWTLWANASTCTTKNTGTNRTQCQTITSGPSNTSSCTSGAANGLTTTCSTVTSGPSNTSSCTQGTANGLTTTCSTVTSGPANASSCTPGTANGLTTTCSAVTTGPANASSCTPGTANGLTTTCSTVTTGPANASLCTPGTVGGLTTTCSTVTTGPANASSCAPGTVGGLTTTCPTVNTGPANASSCTPGTVSGLTTTCTTVNTGPANASSCTQGTSNGLTTTCSALITGPTNASTCTPGTVSGLTTTCTNVNTGPANATSCTSGTIGGLTTTCSNIPLSGPTAVASCTAGTSSGVTTTCQTNTLSSGTPVASCTASAASSSNGYVATTCNTVNTGPTAVVSCTAQPASAGNNWTTTTCTTTASGGTSNTLADVADYYYKTDLRDSSLSNCTGIHGTGIDVCQNIVPTTNQDSASWQHMTTFTLGLGAPGRMIFSPTYLYDTSGDFYSVANGVSANPPSVCSWQASGSGACNWPIPNPSGTPENIDDLWHAAVDGRGNYFSASNPSALSTGLTNALNTLKSILGASAAATTSNPNVVNGDNYVFSSTFQTSVWTSQLIRQQINLSTGVVPAYDPTNPATFDWRAQELLDTTPYTSRTIYTYNGTTNPPSLQVFNSNFASSTNFNTPNISSLSQFCSTGTTCLSSASQASASGANLVNYLLGDRTHEGAVDPINSPNAFYRPRAHILGDIVDSESVYVNSTLFQYADPGFNTYVASLACRQPMVYVGANDGMLHAFYATSGPANTPCPTSSVIAGSEAWGYIPSTVLGNLYKLADENYANNHQFYVNGTAVVNDICVSNCTNAATASWKTILVGGLNQGGRGYYALDITNPTSPNVLWEFTDPNLGDTYGNPIVTKLNNGTWVVLVTSGYNNVSPGDGQGRLYVLDAATGAIITQIPTGAGNTSTPSGLARINAWANNASVDNTALRVYGGDLQGNLWRFDLSNAKSGTFDVQLLVTFKDAGGNPQPITAKPELGSVTGLAVVYVGTGEFLGISDLSTTQQQSFYAVKDTLAKTGAGTSIWTTPRTATCSGTSTTNCFVLQTLTSGTCPLGSTTCTAGQAVFTGTANVVNLVNQSGWYLDLPNQGERANTDPKLLLGSLVFNTNTPSVSTCTVGGFSDQYILNYLTGGAINSTSNTVTTVRLENAFASRAVLSVLPNNIITAITGMSNGTILTTNIPIGQSPTSIRRISWHELISN
jgi:type IV pilus assembly protein PilY1